MKLSETEQLRQMVRRDRVYENKQAAVTSLNLIVFQEKGEIVTLPYKIDDTNNPGALDSIVAVSTKEGVGPGSYSIISDQNIRVIHRIIRNAEDISNVVHGEHVIYYDTETTKHYDYYFEGKRGTINAKHFEELTKSFYFTCLEDNKYYYYDFSQNEIFPIPCGGTGISSGSGNCDCNITIDPENDLMYYKKDTSDEVIYQLYRYVRVVGTIYENPVITVSYSDISFMGGKSVPTITYTQKMHTLREDGTTGQEETVKIKPEDVTITYSGVGVNETTGEVSAEKTTSLDRKVITTATISVTINDKTTTKSVKVYQESAGNPDFYWGYLYVNNINYKLYGESVNQFITYQLIEALISNNIEEGEEFIYTWTDKDNRNNQVSLSFSYYKNSGTLTFDQSNKSLQSFEITSKNKSFIRDNSIKTAYGICIIPTALFAKYTPGLEDAFGVFSTLKDMSNTVFAGDYFVEKTPINDTKGEFTIFGFEEQNALSDSVITTLKFKKN